MEHYVFSSYLQKYCFDYKRNTDQICLTYSLCAHTQIDTGSNRINTFTYRTLRYFVNSNLMNLPSFIFVSICFRIQSFLFDNTVLHLLPLYVCSIRGQKPHSIQFMFTLRHTMCNIHRYECITHATQRPCLAFNVKHIQIEKKTEMLS